MLRYRDGARFPFDVPYLKRSGCLDEPVAGRISGSVFAASFRYTDVRLAGHARYV